VGVTEVEITLSTSPEVYTESFGIQQLTKTNSHTIRIIMMTVVIITTTNWVPTLSVLKFQDF